MTPLLGRVERVPARELLHLINGKANDAIVRCGPGGLVDYTVAELRRLAETGQGVDLPVLSDPKRGLWTVEQ